MQTLNLGILAHVDAGKTSLTERLLHAAGVIDEVGSVDAGTTQTDTLALERERGITIKSAVVSFPLDGVTVNLIDTPGHPDFIAEVERALGVLDGAVLVVSAVEGVQPQTRKLLHALRRLAIPALIFVNKIDRQGAGEMRVLEALAAITPAVIPLQTVRGAGTAQAGVHPHLATDHAFRARLLDALTHQDDALLAEYLEAGGEVLSHSRLIAALRAQVASAAAYPVLFGSARTGAGVPELMDALQSLLPAPERDAGQLLSARVFKIDRGRAGVRVAYARVAAGTLVVRRRLHLSGGGEGRATALAVFHRGGAEHRAMARAGEIAKIWGLDTVQVGDVIGGEIVSAAPQFPPPSLESLVEPRHPDQRLRLWTALGRLAEQDPLIGVRQDQAGGLHVSVYGEVQKQVLSRTLREEHDVEADFRETTTLLVERPRGSGTAVEVLGVAPNPFAATVGFRIEPAPPASGVGYHLEVELGSLPLSFMKAAEEAARATLAEGGLQGWPVLDCKLTMTRSGYSSPVSSASDFRHLSPLVVMAALRQAGTVVCEPVHSFRLEAPPGALGRLAAALARLAATPGTPVVHRGWAVLEGTIPAARVRELEQWLPGLTGGEGAFESAFDHYRPVHGRAPARPRPPCDALDRERYLLYLSGRTSATA